MSRIIQFYLNQTTTTDNKNGYLFDDILQWNNEKLERTHDYIQYLFPLKEKSKYNKDALTLTDMDIYQFKYNQVLRKNVRKALSRMLSFYGIHEVVLKKYDYIDYIWDRKTKHWLSLNNHNYLRLTRIMKFLMMIKMEYRSIKLFIALCNIYNSQTNSQTNISKTTMKYWRDIFKNITLK